MVGANFQLGEATFTRFEVHHSGSRPKTDVTSADFIPFNMLLYSTFVSMLYYLLTKPFGVLVIHCKKGEREAWSVSPQEAESRFKNEASDTWVAGLQRIQVKHGGDVSCNLHNETSMCHALSRREWMCLSIDRKKEYGTKTRLGRKELFWYN